jgi:hypothetical protein
VFQNKDGRLSVVVRDTACKEVLAMTLTVTKAQISSIAGIKVTREIGDIPSEKSNFVTGRKLFEIGKQCEFCRYGTRVLFSHSDVF